MSLSAQDQELLRAFQGQSCDAEADRIRYDDNDDDYRSTRETNTASSSFMHSSSTTDHNPFEGDPNATDDKVARILDDQQIRQTLGLGGTPGATQTGPKGVLADYKFHQAQEKAR